MSTKQLILGLFDSKAEMFLRPFFVTTLGVAFRDLSGEINRGGHDNPLAMHTGDFVLYQLGTFDVEHGLIDSIGCPTVVCPLSALVTDASSVMRATEGMQAQ